jgi:tetratricopeptide repeat protein 21B
MAANPMNLEIASLSAQHSLGRFSEVYGILLGIVERFPQKLKLIVRMIEIGARAGKLNEIRVFLRKYSGPLPNIHIARGLYLLYRRKGMKALSCFSKARDFQKWRNFSERTIFGILINPHQRFLFFEAGPLANDSSLEAATTLLASMNLSDTERRILTAELDLSRRTERSISRAHDLFHSVLQHNPHNLQASLGLAKAFFVANNLQECQTLLSPIISCYPTLDTFAIVEEALLLMSQVTRSNNSREFIDRAIDLNLSCGKAWELRGQQFMAEKKYGEATFAFAQFWKLSTRNEAESGYNYAYCCMKVERWIEAIGVCRNILAIYPNYRDIEERIVRPCYRNLWADRFPSHTHRMDKSSARLFLH